MSSLKVIAFVLLGAITTPDKHDGIVFSNALHAHDQHRTAGATAAARGRAGMPSRTQIVSPKVEIGKNVIDNNKASAMMTLKFSGEAVVTSKPAPTDNNDKSLHDFFALPQSAPLLMRGSKNNQVKELESIDPDLLKQYHETCDRVNALPPTCGDRIFEVTTSGVKFLPGLQVMNVATVGVKVTNQELPGYELVFIRNLTYAKGNRLFVWFFDKVTGTDKDGNKDEPKNGGQTTLSLNRISVVPTENGLISFESNAYLSIQIQFPSFLIKAIPGASKEKSEKSGGDSLRKVLEDDCPGSLEIFRQEYVRWLES